MPTRPTFRTAAALLLLAAAAPVPAFAQRTGDATLPFHAGQWGLSVNVAQSTGVGLVRFTAPTRAIVLDVAASLRRDDRVIPETPFSPRVREGSIAGSVFAALGLRRFRALAGDFALYRTFGVDGSYQGGGSGSPVHSWSAGLFGDVGAQYMIDPHFGLAVSTGLHVGYVEYRSPTGFDGTVTRSNSAALGTTPARLTGAVYF